jgi:hypothetical protein
MFVILSVAKDLLSRARQKFRLTVVLPTAAFLTPAGNSACADQSAAACPD